MLPLNAYDQHKSDDFKPGIRITSKLFSWLKNVLEEKTSRNIFCFLLLNLVFAFLELAYGIWTNSLGLISDSFHMFFDCTALLTGLIATVITRWGKNERFSYGYVRAEIMAGFMNALFLMFVAFFIFSEAVERAFHPPHVEHERLFIISVLGFVVNLIGIFVFGHGHGDEGHGHSHAGSSHGHSHFGGGASHHGHSHSSHAKSLLKDEFEQDDFHNDFHTKKKRDHHGHSHGGNDHGHSHGIHDSSGNIKVSNKQIMQGVFLHILADTLGSVGVILSSLLIKYFDFMMADPLCSMLISILISLSIWPLLMDSMSILMQRTPKEIEYELPIAYQRVGQLDGVFSVQDPHFWTLCSKNYVGTIRLLVAPQADASTILSQTHGIFNQAEDPQDGTARPFQLRPSILSGGSGFGSVFDGNKGGLGDTPNKRFMLRPSALSSATEKLETQPKLETRKRSLQDENAPDTDKEAEESNSTPKKTKLDDQTGVHVQKEPNLKLTEDLQKPTGIGTFGFDKNTETNRESKTNSDNGQGNSFPNYFAQGKSSNEKLSFVFGNNTTTSVVGFNSISKEHVDNNNKNENVTENGNNENEVPVVERDNDKLLENANEYQKSHDEKRIHLEEVERITGEEGEKHVLQIFCKLHLFDKEKKIWLEKGRGTLNLNDICQSEGLFQSRLVFRTQGTNIVQLNTKLWADMCCEKVKEKNIRITAMNHETQEVKVYLISTNMKDCLQTYTAIDRRIEALKRNRENKQEEECDKDDDSQDSKPSTANSEDCTEKPAKEQSTDSETKD